MAFYTFLSGLCNCLLIFFVNNIIKGGAKVFRGVAENFRGGAKSTQGKCAPPPKIRPCSMELQLKQLVTQIKPNPHYYYHIKSIITLTKHCIYLLFLALHGFSCCSLSTSSFFVGITEHCYIPLLSPETAMLHEQFLHPNISRT